MTEDDDPFVRALNNSIEQRQHDSAEQRHREIAETNEDRLFLLSLLSTLQGLPPNIKMTTKIKMLTLLNDASNYSSNRTYDYTDRSFRHTSEANPNSGLVTQENYHPGYSTQRRVTNVSEYPGTSCRTNTNYPNETVTSNSNTMMSTTSPSDTHSEYDYMELFDSQNT